MSQDYRLLREEEEDNRGRLEGVSPHREGRENAVLLRKSLGHQSQDAGLQTPPHRSRLATAHGPNRTGNETSKAREGGDQGIRGVNGTSGLSKG